MRLLIIAAFILLPIFFAPLAGATPHTSQFKAIKSKLNKGGLVIRVVEGDWGTANVEDIENLLYSVANELWAYFPQKKLPPLIVKNYGDSPMVLYEKGPMGEYIVYLSAKDMRWSQFAYQFAHEFAHILSNYDNKEIKNKLFVKHNQWFEETICEIAALFTLKRLATTWETAAPYESWTVYASAFQDYADHLLNESHRQLVGGKTLADWYFDNQEALSSDPYRREKNEVVANTLLALFERNPENWESISFLNYEKNHASKGFHDYLDSWYLCAPEKHKGFIRQTIAMFDRPSTAQASIAPHPQGRSGLIPVNLR
ncbi:MAG: hypothetical protein H7X91_09960 [Burkholderiales bacterium]|nr:hypothetical protein [Burkholderiales bacterium]